MDRRVGAGRPDGTLRASLTATRHNVAVILPVHDRAGPGHMAPPAAPRTGDAALSPLYGPLLAAPTAADGCYVLGRIAQSLDGRIATASGASHWISGPEDIVHTHRLRALFDAVVVGAGTVRADDPQLTTREVRRSVAGARGARHRPPAGCAIIACSARGRRPCCSAPLTRPARIASATRRCCACRVRGKGLAIAAVLAALAARGLRRVFVEGGGITVSRFLAAGALDRLHVTIAPLLIGSGIPAFTLPEAATLTDVLRFDWSVHRVGADLLVDIPLSARAPGARA